MVAIQSAIGLARRGWDVTFFSAVPPIDPALLNAGVKVSCLGIPASLDNPSRALGAIMNLWNRNAAKQLWRLLQDESNVSGDTIIHVHGWTKALSSACLACVRASGRRAFLTLHDYFSVCPNGAFYDYQTEQVCDAKPLSARCLSSNCDKNSRTMKAYRVLRQIVQNKAGKFGGPPWKLIAVSEFSRARIARFMPSAGTCDVIACPISVARGPAASPNLYRRLVALGRLSPEKGVVLLAKAALLAAMEITFIGSGESEPLIRAANPTATILGWLSHDAAIDELRRSRALVFPSRCYETQGLVVPEAAALGIPSIVSDVTSASDNVIDGRTGLLFRSGSVEALVARLRELQDDAKVAAMGHAAYDHYWQKPRTLDQYIDRLETIYLAARETRAEH